MTIKEIASIAGVGVSTVSRYLNDGYVSDEKRRIIAGVIKEHNYRPSEAAINLRGKSKEVVVIVQRVSSNTTSRFLEGLIQQGSKQNLVISIQVVNFDESLQQAYINAAIARKVYGIIVYSFTENIKADYDNLLVVGQKSAKFKSLYSQGRKIYQQLVSTIIANNLVTNVAILGIEIMDIEFMNRVAGTIDAAKAAKIDYQVYQEDFAKIHHDFTMKLGTYYVCLTDAQAYQLIQIANRNNFRVGIDVFISGYGDYSTSELLELTTVDGLYEELGINAITNIISASSKSQEINPQIKYRASARNKTFTKTLTSEKK